MFELGDKVQFQKEWIFHKNTFVGKTEQKYWERDYKQPLTGIICGKRTKVIEGKLEGGGEEPFCLIQKVYKQVYVIACNLKRFYLVPEEFIEVVKEG
jgi:hypothetical protein